MRARPESASSYLQQTRVERCLSFENRKSLFDIHAQIQIRSDRRAAAGPTSEMRCGFYLTDFRDRGA